MMKKYTCATSIVPKPFQKVVLVKASQYELIVFP